MKAPTSRVQNAFNQEDWEFKMKKIAFATAATLLLTGAASAADLAARPYTKAPAPMVSVYNWTGFYIGVNGGGGWADKSWDIYNNGGVAFPAFREGSPPRAAAPSAVRSAIAGRPATGCSVSK